jgi:hypothetical protein
MPGRFPARYRSQLIIRCSRSSNPAHFKTNFTSPMLIWVVGTGTLAGAMASRGRALPQAAGRGAKGTRTPLLQGSENTTRMKYL